MHTTPYRHREGYTHIAPHPSLQANQPSDNNLEAEYCHDLPSSEAYKRLDTIKKHLCKMPVHPSLGQKVEQGILPKFLHFGLFKFYTHLSKIGGHQIPTFLIGGAAEFALSNVDKGDIDLCFYTKCIDILEIKKYLFVFFQNELHFRGYVNVDLQTIEKAYKNYDYPIYNEQNELTGLLVSFHGIDVKFSTRPYEGFHIDLFSNKVAYIDEQRLGDHKIYHQNLQALHNRIFLVKNPENMTKLVFRVLLKLTRGFSVSQEMLQIAWEKMKNEYTFEQLANHYSSHQCNHYGKTQAAKIIDFLNFLSLSEHLNVESKEKGNYNATISGAFLRNVTTYRTFPNNRIYTFIQVQPQVAQHLVAYIRGVLLCESENKKRWKESSDKDNRQPPKIRYLSGLILSHGKKGTFHLALPHKLSISTISQKALNDWAEMEGIFKEQGKNTPKYYLQGFFEDLGLNPRLVDEEKEHLLNQLKELALWDEPPQKVIGDSLSAPFNSATSSSSTSIQEPIGQPSLPPPLIPSPPQLPSVGLILDNLLSSQSVPQPSPKLPLSEELSLASSPEKVQQALENPISLEELEEAPIKIESFADSKVFAEYLTTMTLLHTLSSKKEKRQHKRRKHY